MVGYTLQVFHHEEPSPTETVRVERAVEVMTAIPSLLEKHPDCSRIRVYAGYDHIFSVDCSGRTVKD